MPLPQSHVASLEPHLRIHNEQILALRASHEALSRDIERRERGESSDPNPKPGSIPGLVSQRELIEQNIRQHEALLALGENRLVLDALGELFDSPHLAREASRDPKAFAKGRGIDLPTTVELELTVYEDRVRLRVTNYDDLVPFVLTWTDEGFSPPAHDRTDMPDLSPP